jgi:CRP/FNR family transcriptional regulator, cyclic AMP receptor protein
VTGTARPLAAYPVFAQLPETELELIASTARTVQFAARQRLFAEGHPAQGCWLIEDGRVALDMTVPGRGQVVVQTLEPGDVLGWSWLVPPYRWHYGATSVVPVTATELDTGQLRTLAEQNPQFGYTLVLTLFEAVLQRLQATRARLLDLYGSPHDQR